MEKINPESCQKCSCASPAVISGLLKSLSTFYMLGETRQWKWRDVNLMNSTRSVYSCPLISLTFSSSACLVSRCNLICFVFIRLDYKSLLRHSVWMYLFIPPLSVMFSDVTVPKETLLRPPSSEKPVFEREELSYSGCSECFRLGERSFSRQYAHIYATRLMQMREILSERAQQKWGEGVTPLRGF